MWWITLGSSRSTCQGVFSPALGWVTAAMFIEIHELFIFHLIPENPAPLFTSLPGRTESSNRVTITHASLFEDRWVQACSLNGNCFLFHVCTWDYC